MGLFDPEMREWWKQQAEQLDQKRRARTNDCHLGSISREQRVGILELLHSSGATEGRVWRRFARRHGYPIDEGDYIVLFDTIKTRWGNLVADSYDLGLDGPQTPLAELRELPERDFGLAIECGLELLHETDEGEGEAGLLAAFDRAWDISTTIYTYPQPVLFPQLEQV
jgi:hypothetical protein